MVMKHGGRGPAHISRWTSAAIISAPPSGNLRVTMSGDIRVTMGGDARALA